VLFPDELPEFHRHVLEVLRQPLEDGVVTLSRAAARLSFPARFTLVAAMNPCPCGHLGDPVRPCRCGPALIERYRARISGPLLDRIDIHLPVPAVPYSEIAGDQPAEPSAAIRARVEAARARQRERFRAHRGLHANAHMSTREVRRYCRPGPELSGRLRPAGPGGIAADPGRERGAARARSPRADALADDRHLGRGRIAPKL